VDCNEVRLHAGGAIDGFLEQEIKADFQAHLERCRPCRNEVELEKLSKHMVRRHVSWISTPRSIKTLIVSSLHHEYQSSGPERELWRSLITQFWSLVPTLVGSVIAVSFFVMVRNSGDQYALLAAHTAENDVIHQSFDTFGLFRSGQFIPATISSVPESVSGFFRQRPLPFIVQVPQVPGCDWCGGGSSEIDGIHQAHLLYKRGKDWIYIRETSSADALGGFQCSLPPAAKIALAQSGWYTDPAHPQCNVVVWEKNEVVCVAVSTIGKQQLLALLNPSPHPRLQF
jgi:hypothetical protein